MKRPELYSTNFITNDLIHFSKEGIVEKYIQLSHVFNADINSKFNNIIPEAGSFDTFHDVYQAFLNANIPLTLLCSKVDAVNLTGLTRTLEILIEFTIYFFETGINMEMNEAHFRTFYALCAKGIFSISILLSPICPGIAKKIQSFFYSKSNRHNCGVDNLNKWVIK
jgi:methionyl-tRNA synthetase